MRKSNQKKIFIVIGIIVLLGIIVGVSYAWWSSRATQTTVNKISSDCLKIEIEDVNNSAISIEKAYPLTDEEAKELPPYTFKVKNTCSLGVTYDVNLEVMDVEDRLQSQYIAASFEERGKQILNTYPSVSPSYKEDYVAVEAYGLTSGTLGAGESRTYTIKLWIDESVTVEDDAMNKTFIGKISVNASLNQVAEVYKEEVLKGTDPVIKGDLVPVIIANDGTVTKANLEAEWYSYEKKTWANAVILVDKTKSYNSYDVIPEENIESYFVWIPKYSYQIWDLGNYTGVTELDESKVHEIPIKFGTTDTSDANVGECTTPMNANKTQGLSGESGNCQVGDYMTHPAFISMNTNGLWVGKFETGYKGAKTTEEAEQNITDATKVQIKPNVYSWRNINVLNAHLTSYNYKRELDSHMMKNTEWGSVAYLQHSAYGSATSVRINNNSASLTGYAAINEPTTFDTTDYESTAPGVDGEKTINYLNSASGVASTTGNKSGVYDMAGGVSEFVMGVLVSDDGTPVIGRKEGNSGFSGLLNAGEGTLEGVPFPSSKYYDSYAQGSNVYSFDKRILGDGLGEMGPFIKNPNSSNSYAMGSWYNNTNSYLMNYSSWVIKGGSGIGGGIFASGRYTGQTSLRGFRIVLAI